MKDKVWSLGKLDLFKGLSEKKIKELEDLFHMREYCKREVILDPSTCCKVYIVKTGRVEIYHLTPDGRKVIIDVLKPGSIFADLGGAFNSGVFVETIEDSYICSIDKDIFFKSISQEPVIAERLMRHLFDRLMRMEEKASSLAVDSVFDKFVKLLISLGKKEDDENTMYITDKYTHEQLSQMIGVSRQTLTSVINQLEKQNVLHRDKKRFQFNKKQLESLSN